MEKLKLLMLAASMLIMMNTAPSFAQTNPKVPAKTETKAAKPEEKKRPNADGRTKTGDKINKGLKGPNGETVYTGPKGGNYYLGKNDEKIYLKSK